MAHTHSPNSRSAELNRLALIGLIGLAAVVVAIGWLAYIAAFSL